MRDKIFETNDLLLVLPTTEYQKRVPISISTSSKDSVIISL